MYRSGGYTGLVGVPGPVSALSDVTYLIRWDERAPQVL